MVEVVWLAQCILAVHPPTPIPNAAPFESIDLLHTRWLSGMGWGWLVAGRKPYTLASLQETTQYC